MAEYTFTIEADGLTDPRLENLDDLYDALIRDGRLLGPALGANRVSGAISLIATVEAGDEARGANLISRAFADALIATTRATSVARVGRAALEGA
jgi:hypothetical protein